MSARTRTSLLWGVVAALMFLVLLQGYVIAGGEPATMPVTGGVALAVGACAAVVSYLLKARLGPQPRRDAESSGADHDGRNQSP